MVESRIVNGPLLETPPPSPLATFPETVQFVERQCSEVVDASAVVGLAAADDREVAKLDDGEVELGTHGEDAVTPPASTVRLPPPSRMRSLSITISP